MKRLAILRHAKSSWGDPGVADHDRPLNNRGRKAARRVGREMKERGLRFDQVLASTAQRVRQTLDGLTEEFALDAGTDFDPRVYGASEDLLLDLIRRLPDTAHSVLLVGHNPGLERLVVELGRDDANGFREQVGAKYPTGALAVMELSVNRWSNVEPASGEIVALILPRELD